MQPFRTFTSVDAAGRRVVRRGAAKAFTMLEIMLAVAIFAGVLTAIYSCWASVTRGTRIGLAAAASAQRAHVASRALEDALATVTVFQDNITNYAFIAEMNGDYTTVEFTAYLPESFPGFGVFDGLPVRRIRFAVESGTNGSPQLVMTQMPYLLTVTPDQEPYPIVLAKDVSVFALHFWDTNAHEWVDEWTQNTNQLPGLIRYEMAFDDKGDKSSVAGISSGVVAPATVAVPPSGFGRGGGGPGNPTNRKPNPNANPNANPNNSINNNLGQSTPGRNTFFPRPSTSFGNNGGTGFQGIGGFGNGGSPNNSINNFGSGAIGNNTGFLGNNAGNPNLGGGGIGGNYGRSAISGGTIPTTTGNNVSGRSGIGGTTSPVATNSGVSGSSSILNSTNPPGLNR